MKLTALLLLAPLAAATPIPDRKIGDYTYGAGANLAAAQPVAAPADAAPAQPTDIAGQDWPAIFRNSTDWWRPGTALHGKYAEKGVWDGVDNTAGVGMYIDERGVAITYLL